MTEYIRPDDTLNIYYRVSEDTKDIEHISVSGDENDISNLNNIQNVKKIQWSPDEEHLNETFTFDIKGFGTKEIVVNEIPNSEDGDDIDEITIDGTEYRVHTFKNDGTFTIDKDTEVDILVVGGGGGGGGCSSRNAGGGGGGGVVFEQNILISSNEYTIKVGDGGNKGDGGDKPGFNGENSSALGYKAIGGGGGGGAHSSERNTENDGRDGGSGGGVGGITSEGNVNGETVQSEENTNKNPEINTGNDGGLGTSQGGGGGAAESGEGGKEAENGMGGFGGAGREINITGESVYYGGGGDAVTYNRTETSRNGATGYKDIAKDVGAGGSATDSDARDENSAYGKGGSGIVIIRYVIE